MGDMCAPACGDWSKCGSDCTQWGDPDQADWGVCGVDGRHRRSGTPCKMTQQSELKLRQLHKTLLEAPCRENGGLGGYEHHAPETCWPCFVRSLYPATKGD